MEHLFETVEHLRNRLGAFYWTLRHDGDRELAAEQLRSAITLAARVNQSADPPTSLFQRWTQQQLHSLLGAAKQVLERLGLEPQEESQKETSNAPIAL